MARADINKWNRKYRDNPTLSPGAADPELLAYQALFPTQGLALDLACGTGSNSLLLARLGLDVVAIDGAAEGLKQLGKYALADGLQGQIKCVEADLDEYILPVSSFDLVVVVRYLDRNLFSAIEKALKPGGLLLYKTFNQNMLKLNSGFNVAYTIETQQLIEAFSGFEVLKENTRDVDAIHAFLIARKPA